MEQDELQPSHSVNAPASRWVNARILLLLLLTLLLFLFAINLMVASLQQLSSIYSDAILIATANPFNGLFIGLLVTAMLQSSSTTTSIVVAFVASGSLSVGAAVPIIMGANIGTTITSTIVSLGFINKKKEFRRAVAAGTYHDFFNILTATVLFPLEYYYGFLSGLASELTGLFLVPVFHPGDAPTPPFTFGFSAAIEFLMGIVSSGLVLACLALMLLFTSILIFRRLASELLQAGHPEAFSRFFFKGEIKSFFWGIVTTAAIRSSTITTSVVVPIVAKKMVNLRKAAPFIMGANVGTTITAFIAVLLNANTREAITIALVHFLFNVLGVLIFFPIPGVRELPFRLAEGLGRLTLRYRLAGFVYLLSTFFFIPFTLIYFSQDSINNYNLLYERNAEGGSSHYRISYYENIRTGSGEWRHFRGKRKAVKETPFLVEPVLVKNNAVFVGRKVYFFARPGKCWDVEDTSGSTRMCVEAILPHWRIADVEFDSVYIFSRSTSDTARHKYYFATKPPLLLMHEVETAGSVRVLEKLVSFQRN